MDRYFLSFVAGVPESCLLMLFGIFLGLFMDEHQYEESSHNVLSVFIDPHTFFLFILPPIVFEAGYEMPRVNFLSNLYEILTYAIIGTTINAFITGMSLYGISHYIGFGEFHGTGAFAEENFSVYLFLIFGAIVSAVDPVAVIAVFDEIHVNVTLYILVFGESLLNDGVAMVLFQVFQKFIFLGDENVNAETMFLGFISFFVVAGGGLIIGVCFGLFTAWASKYTSAMDSLEPIVVLGLAYLSYLIADALEMSGIIAIVFCGLTMRHYTEKNMSKETNISLHHISSLMALVAEMTIFVMLGIETTRIKWLEHWYWKFTLTTLIIIEVSRLGVTFLLTKILNRYRINKITVKDMLIMSISGLRGGIAFALMELADLRKVVDKDDEKAFIVTTIFIVFFTVFVQGSLCGYIVEFFGTAKEIDENDETYKKIGLNCYIHDITINYLTDGIMELLGDSGNSNFTNVNKFEHTQMSLLDPILLKKKKKLGSWFKEEDWENLNFHEMAEHLEEQLHSDLSLYQREKKEIKDIKRVSVQKRTSRSMSIVAPPNLSLNLPPAGSGYASIPGRRSSHSHKIPPKTAHGHHIFDFHIETNQDRHKKAIVKGQSGLTKLHAQKSMASKLRHRNHSRVKSLSVASGGSDNLSRQGSSKSKMGATGYGIMGKALSSISSDKE